MNYLDRILVTGGAGFIGSNFLNAIVPRYPNNLFVNLDVLTYAGNLANLTVANQSNYVFEQGNICDQNKLSEIFDKYQLTALINFAAETHVDFSIKQPSAFVKTNIEGTHNLLQFALKYQLRRFYQISTDEVYGSLNEGDAPFTTQSPLAPNSPYSASKAAADLLVRSYQHTFGLDTVISRCSNNYGPNQDESKLIPKAIRCLEAGQKIPIYATGKNIRDWLFVSDHVEAIDLIFHQGKPGKIYNIGGNCEVRNIDIAKKLSQAMSKGENTIEFVADRPGHDFRYALDTSEITSALGWRPKVSFDEGIASTINFYTKIRKAS